MTDKTEKLSVELNDAFARLEQEQGQSTKQSDKTTGRQSDAKKPDRTATAKTGSGSIIGILLGLIGISIASYGAFTAYQLQEARDSDARGVANLETNLTSITEEVKRLQEGLSDSAVAAENNLQALSVEQGQMIQAIETKLDSSLLEVKKSAGTTGEDWLIAEAEYLIRLASQRVLMEGDPKGAIALLDAADGIIRDNEAISAFDLRQALANDMASLKAVADLDVDGLFVRLAALIDQIDELEQKSLVYNAPVEEAAPETSTDWLSRLAAIVVSAGSRLASLVDHRAEGEVITPILPPEEEYYLRQNLVLKLQLAQLGLLRSNQQIYSTSLDEAKNWVSHYFDPEDAKTVAVLTGISGIQSVDVEQEMPEIGSSLREVRKLLARFHEQEARELVQ